MLGTITDLLSFSLNDGPGIRTTVFMKGCPLHCPWCHNPEAISREPQLLYAAAKCLGCGACAAACPAGARGRDGALRRDHCVSCGSCVPVCPAGANRLTGTQVTPEEIVERAVRDKPFFRSRGGVTFSGGEPLLQSDFVGAYEELLLARGVSCAIETSCAVSWEVLRPLVPLTNIFLCDWKITDPSLHLALTGADNALIGENLIRLDEMGARIILRCPVIPGVNDSDAHFSGIAAWTRQLSRLEKVDILPYHDIGNDKRRSLSLLPAPFPVPTEAQKEAWLTDLSACCAVPVCM